MPASTPTLHLLPIRDTWQVLMYNHMEHYSAHHDFFDPAAYATNEQMLASVEHGAMNRLATVSSRPSLWMWTVSPPPDPVFSSLIVSPPAL